MILESLPIVSLFSMVNPYHLVQEQLSIAQHDVAMVNCTLCDISLFVGQPVGLTYKKDQEIHLSVCFNTKAHLIKKFVKMVTSRDIGTETKKCKITNIKEANLKDKNNCDPSHPPTDHLYSLL